MEYDDDDDGDGDVASKQSTPANHSTVLGGTSLGSPGKVCSMTNSFSFLTIAPTYLTLLAFLFIMCGLIITVDCNNVRRVAV